MSTKKQRIEAAKLLGSAKSPAKADAARRNAKLPRKKNEWKDGDRGEWYDLFFNIHSGTVVGNKPLRTIRRDGDGYLVPVDPNPQLIHPIGTLDRDYHKKFIKTLK